MVLRVVIFILVMSLLACGAGYKEPHALYNAPFDPQQIDGVVEFIYEIADKWNLELEEKDRGQMKYLTQGQEAFRIYLVLEGDMVILIGNAGFGTTLSLMVMDYGHMPVEELDRLTNEIKSELERRFALEFCTKDPYTSLCID